MSGRQRTPDEGTAPNDAPAKSKPGTVTAGVQTGAPDGWDLPTRHPDDPDYYALRARDNGIPHDPACTWADVHEAHRASGEVIFSCGSCKSRAIWLGGVLQQDLEEDERQLGRRIAEKERLTARAARLAALRGLGDGAAEAGEPIPPRSVDRVRQCHATVAKLRRELHQVVTVSAIHAHTGITRETISGYVHKGWLSLDED